MDQKSSNFNPRDWFQHLRSLRNNGRSTSAFKRGGFLFTNVSVYAAVDPNAFLPTFGNAPLHAFKSLVKHFKKASAAEVQILHHVEGFVDEGELLTVLGRPGSGCTTLLKTLAGEWTGFRIDKDSEILYQGIDQTTMHTEFRGECIYTAELDEHFPELTVLETLEFAAASRVPAQLSLGVSNAEYLDHVTSGIMSAFQLESARDTRIGSVSIRGVSGGEKKRVSIAESFMSFAPVQFWDNSTRGLDSATAYTCMRAFQAFAQTNGASISVSLYQASQRILDCFDKVIILYEGRQIFFGSWSDSLEYFHGLGFERPAQLTTGDYLTALTQPSQVRSLIRSDFPGLVPTTADEFASRWQQSFERQKLLQQISHVRDRFKHDGNGLQQYREARSMEKHSGVARSSPFTVPVSKQIALCVGRGFKRLRNNIGVPIGYVIGNVVMAIIVGSVFINLGDNADDVSKRTILLFFAVLINAFMSAQEVLTVWAGRSIVEKQTKRSLYHPAAEAVSDIICSLPQKLAASILFNVVLYLMANLRRTPGAFFTFWIITFACQMSMSLFYRCDGSLYGTLEASMVPVGVLIMLAIIYTGFVIPVPYMKPWLAWFRHINPVAYAFESLVANEFHDRTFPCAQFIPSGPFYANVSSDFKSCVGTAMWMGARYLQGDEYMQTVYGHSHAHLWRNLGIIVAFSVLFLALHIWSSENVTTQKPKGDVLMYLRNKQPSRVGDEEKAIQHASQQGSTETRIYSDAGLIAHTKTLHWESVNYSIPTKKDTEKRILEGIEGMVRPGTVTALMGATGAGKTSLLDIIAQRTTHGIVTGNIMVNGHLRSSSFQRSTGYAQQNDIHLRTATVREALRFSALLRQPHDLPKAAKVAYAEKVIDLLGMQTYADAVIGAPGDGLSPEQRKRLTIAVELAARPTTALFLDEPTSGLDSETATSICKLIHDLAHNSGQAILCTIHQPSAALLSLFDNLLLIDEGKTVYFGEIGVNACTVKGYFESKGAQPCGPEENPAEWFMNLNGSPFLSDKAIDWHTTWHNSQERQAVKDELSKIKDSPVDLERSELSSPYATSIWTQVAIFTQRTFVEYWRTPVAVWAKLMLYAAASLMIGLSCFRSPKSIQGLTNQMFSIFLLFTTFSNIMQQMVPQFVERRTLFEACERPSRTVSWIAFVFASITVEATWQVALAVISWVLFYYLTGMNLNANDSEEGERAILMLLFFIAFLLFTQSLAHLLVAAVEVPEAAINMGQPIFYLTIIFCGVLLPKRNLPRFWLFMYRVSPLTYLMRGMFATGVSGQTVSCASSEVVLVPKPPDNQTCGTFLGEFIKTSGGTVLDPDAKDACAYCPMESTDQFLSFFNMQYSERWRDLGIVIAFILFNWLATFVLYWLVRVPKRVKIVEAVSMADRRENGDKDKIEKQDSTIRIYKG